MSPGIAFKSTDNSETTRHTVREGVSQIDVRSCQVLCGLRGTARQSRGRANFRSPQRDRRPRHKTRSQKFKAEWKYEVKSIPKSDLFLDALGQVEFRVLAVDQDFCFSVAHAGIRDSKLPF